LSASAVASGVTWINSRFSILRSPVGFTAFAFDATPKITRPRGSVVPLVLWRLAPLHLEAIAPARHPGTSPTSAASLTRSHSGS
jgi:hypothetical protein